MALCDISTTVRVKKCCPKLVNKKQRGLYNGQQAKGSKLDFEIV